MATRPDWCEEYVLDHPSKRAAPLARQLLKRSTLFRNALVALYASVVLFGLGSLLGGVINIWRPKSLWLVGSLTIVGIGCVVYASIQLLRESLNSIRVIREQSNSLEEQETSEATRPKQP